MRTRNAPLLMQSAASIALFAALAAGAGHNAVSQPSPASETSKAKDAIKTSQGFAPLGYFDQNCARCHGAYGSFYGEGFGKGRDDAGLRQVVKEMAEGPAQAPLEKAPLEVLTAYHRSLIDGKPFVVVAAVERQKDGALLLRGEATPDAVVEVSWGAEAQRQTAGARRDGARWTAAVPAAIEPGALRIKAQTKGGQTVVALAQNAYSHAAPLGARDETVKK